MQVDLQVRVEAKHQRAPNARTIALMRAPSCAAHSSCSVTPLGDCADSRAGVAVFAASYLCDDRRTLTGSGFVRTDATSLTVTTGTNADGKGCVVTVSAGAFARSRN